MAKSKSKKLNKEDFKKTFIYGIFIAVVTAVLPTIYELIVNNTFNFSMETLQYVGKVTALAVISILMAKFGTNSNGQVFKSEPKEVK